jgi:NAD(P)-dependent dehydrogenase (short-subunit alcohol dehydrogenase family)
MTDISGKTVVVTGGGSGIGRAIALALSKRGATVVLVGRTESRLRAVADEAAELEGSAVVVPGDVSGIDEVDRIATEVRSKAGDPQILVNAAGVSGQFTTIRESDPERWIKILQINTVGPYLTSRIFVGPMMESGWGRIINVSSAASLGTGHVNSEYSLSKAALNHFTRQLADEVAGSGVTANAIHPGEVKTDMWRAIQDTATSRGTEAQGGRNWAAMVEETGGDPPRKAADLVLEIIDGDVNGKFLWIKDGIKKPMPTWD